MSARLGGVAGARLGFSGAPISGAPSPADGKGVRPCSAAGVPAPGAEAGAPPGMVGAFDGGAASATGLRLSTAAVLRFPNKGELQKASGLPLAQLRQQGAEQALARALGFRTAGQNLRHLEKGFRGFMAGGNLGDHLAVVGGGAEQLRVEGDACDRVVVERLGEVGELDLRPFRHAYLIEAIERAMVVRPRRAQQIDE